MAKRRGRRVSIDGLLATLKDLDRQRSEVTNRLKSALSAALSGVPSPFSTLSAGTNSRRGRAAETTNTRGTRKRRKMSAAARAKISAAQKKRWAAQKSGTK